MIQELVQFAYIKKWDIKMKITKAQLREIIREEIQSIKEATENAEWTKEEKALIKRTKVKVDGKMHKFTIEKF